MAAHVAVCRRVSVGFAAAEHPRSAQCPPLVAAGETLGLVYADSRRPGALITCMDLDLLRVFSERAALWVAARRGMDELSRLLPQRPSWADIVQAQRLAAA